MRLQSFLSKLIDRYFNFNTEEELNETIDIIVQGLKNIECSNVIFSNSTVIQQLNLVGKDRGLVFFEWDISPTRKIFYLITAKCPRIVSLSIRNNGILLKVNNTRRLFSGKPTEKFRINDELADRLEIDISDNFIKFSLKEKEL